MADDEENGSVDSSPDDNSSSDTNNNRQQSNTITNTASTGIENSDLIDSQISDSEDGSGSGSTGDGGGSSSSSSNSDSDIDNNYSQDDVGSAPDSDSNVVGDTSVDGGGEADSSQQAESSSSETQSVGGNTDTQTSSSSSGAGDSDDPASAETTPSQTSTPSNSEEVVDEQAEESEQSNEDLSEDFSSQTTSQTFDVSIEDEDVEEDFDTTTVSQTFDVSFEDENDLAVVADVAYSINEDGSLTFNDVELLAGASDIDGDTLSVDSVSYTGADGVLTDNGDGSYSFAPNENFNGDVALDFSVTDGTTSVAAGINVTVDAVNDTPVAGNTSYQMNEDGSITLSDAQLLANSSDVEGDVSVDSVSYSGSDGIFTDNGDGTYSFAPNENFNGDVSLDVTVADEDGATASTTAGIDVIAVNDTPVSGDLAYSINEDGSITLSQDQLLAQATDVEGDELTADNLTGPDNLTITANDDGSFTLTPDADFNGAMNLSFDISDGTDTSAAGIALTVDPVNDLAQVPDVDYTLNEDGSLTITDAQLLAGASDIDGDTLSVDSVSYTGADGVLTDNGDGSYSFAPNENFNGDVALDFSVSDGTASVDANINLTVDAVNDSPVAGNTSYQMNEDGSITLSDAQLLANSSDVEGDVSIDSVSYSGSDGIFTDNGDGSYSFAPNENFNGDVSLDVTVADEDGATASTTAGIDVVAVNDTPVSGDLAYSINEDGSITLSQDQLLAQATDVEGDALTADNLTGPDNLTITANDDGSFTLTPDADFNGAMDLSFDISDGTDTASAGIALTVDPVNDLPDAGDEINIQAYEDQREEPALRLDQEPQYGVLQASIDDEWIDLEAGQEVIAGTEIRFVADEEAIESATHTTTLGTLDENAILDDWGVEIDSNTRQFTDGDMVITTHSSDGSLAAWNGDGHLGNGIGDDDRNGLSGDEKLTVEVEGQYINEVSFVLDGLGNNFVEGASNATGVQIQAFNADGELIDSEISYSPSGTYDHTYTLTTDEAVARFELGSIGGSGTYVVQSMSLSQTLPDNVQLTSIGFDNSELTETFDFDLRADNITAPIDLTNDVPDIYAGEEVIAPNIITREQLLSQASDIDGDDLDIQNIQVIGDNATLIENDDGTWTVRPNPDFHGDVQVSYEVTDGELVDSNVINVNFEAVQDLAQVPDVDYTLNEDGSLTITDAQLLAGASDIDGDTLSVDSVSYTGADGVLTDNGDGSYSFAPNENFNGDVALDFSVSDGTASVDANINLTVDAVNDSPVAGNTSYQMNEDGSITLSDAQLLANSSDVEGDVSVDSVSYSGSDGIFTDNGDGSYSFAPNENFNGDVSLDVTVADEDGATASTTAGIDVIAVNDTPVSGDLAYSINEDGSITLSQDQLLAQATDVEGDALTADNLTGPDNLTITANDDGSFTLTPDADFNGAMNLSFDISDGTDTASAGIALTVDPVNDLAQVPDVDYTLNEDGSLTITDAQLLAGATDIDGDTLSVDSVSYTGADGVLTDNGDGSYSFAPNENFNGDVALDFSVSDGTDSVDANINLTVDAVNDIPVAGNTSYQMNEDGSITLSDAQLLANSSDVEGNVSVDSVSYSGSDGIFTDNGDGTYSFAPNENFNGDVSLDVTVADEDGATASTTAGIDVVAVNDTPVSGDLAYSINEDGSITLSQDQLLAQATDVEGDALTADNLTGPDNLTITANDDGSFTLTPDADFNGAMDLSFDISDGTDTASAGIALTVDPVNDLAQVPDVDYTLNEDGSLTITDAQLLAGATDIDGDTLSVDSVSYTGADGVLTDNGDGSYSFAPNENFNGDVALDFSVSDGTASVDANINLTVDAVNDSPVAGNTSYQMNEDGSITLSDAQLLANSSDVEGNVSVDSVSYSGSDGIFTDNGDGTYSFAPNENFNGDVSLDVTVADEAGATDTTTAGIDVIAVNDTPVSGDLAYSINEDGSITLSQDQLLAQATDVEGDALTADNLTGPDNLTITANDDGSFTLTPDADFNGAMDLSFDISDGTDTASAGIALTVDPVNDLAQVPDVDYTLNEDGSLTITDAQLLAGATDIDGDTLSVDSVSYTGADGVLTDNGDGSYSFAPNENFNGDVALDFSVSDGTASVDANINLTVDAVNDSPVAGNTSYQMNEDGSITLSDAQLLANSSDVEGNVSVDSVSYSGSDGIFTDNGDGTYSFAPNENFNGDVSLDVTVADEDGATASTTAGIDVVAVNDTPVSGDLAYSINEDGSITLSQDQLLAQATDVEGDALTADNLTGPDNLTITANDDGSFTLTPEADFNGAMDLSFDISDGTDTASAGIALTVDPVNDGIFEAQSMDTSYTEEEVLSMFMSSEPEMAAAMSQESMSIQSLSVPESQGRMVDNGDNTYTFEPAPDFSGEIEMQMSVTDGDQVVAANINTVPQVSGIEASVDEDNSITLTQADLLANANDVDGDDLTALNLTVSGDDATVVENDDGSFTITPDENFNGDIELSYDVTDGTEIAQSGVALTVNSVNDGPVAGSTEVSGDEDTTILITQDDLLANASDIDGDDLTATNVSYTGDDGSLIDNGDGTYAFTPNADFNGDISLSYDVTDGIDTASTTMQVSINATNDAAIVDDQNFTFNEDGTLIITDAQLLSGASDIDGDNLNVDSVSYTGADGVLTDNGDGSYSFAPNENFNGDVALDFSVSDGTESVDANINLTVDAVNDSPVAGNTSYQMNEDGSITLSDAQLLANSSDVEGNVSVDSVSYSGSDGIFTDNGDGTYSFAPNENFNGDVSLDVTVADENGATANTTAGIDVIAVNDLPVAGNTSYQMNEDGSITLSDAQLLANSSDVEGDVSVDSVTYSGNDGIFTDNGDGTYSFAPNENFNGDVSLDVTVADEDGAISSATAEIDVIAVNDTAEVSGDLAYSINEDGSITLTQEQLLANASDVEGDSLTASNLTLESGSGTVVENEDGSFTVTPDNNANGDFSLSYDISDGESTVSSGVNLTVTPVNDAPSAPTVEMQGTEDQVTTIDPEFILNQVTDIDSENLTLTSLEVKQPQNSTLSPQNDGTYQLVTSADFNGVIELAYEVSDEENTVEGTLNVDVAPVNDAVFNTGNTHLTTVEGGEITFNSSDMVDFFDDVDGDQVTISRVIVADGSEAEGSLTDNGDGTWTFVPTESFAGTAELQVVATDGQTESTMDVPVYIRPGGSGGAVITTTHDGPLVFSEDETAIIGFNIELADDSDILSNVVMTGYPVGFTVTDGTYSFTVTEPNQMINVTNWDTTQIQMMPPENWSGDFSITFTATTVDYGDEAWQPEDDSGELRGDFSTAENESIQLTIDDLIAMADIESSDGDAVSIHLPHLIDTSQGTLVDNGDNTWTFNPTEDFSGEVDFAYVVMHNGEMVDAQSSIAVHPAEETTASQDVDVQAGQDEAANTAPESHVMTEDDELTLTLEDLLSNIEGINPDTATISITNIPDDSGTIIDNGDNTWTYWPEADFAGDVNISYQISDGENTESGNLDITIQAVNDAPEVSAPTEAEANVNNPVTVTLDELLANATDIEGDSLQVANLQSDHASITDNGDDTYTITPEADFQGTADITYDVTDGTDTVQTSMSLNVSPEEDGQVEGADADHTVAPNGSVNINLSDAIANDPSVEHVNISGLPEGASLSSGIEELDGSYTVSGDLSQPIQVNFGSEFEGDSTLEISGYDSLGASVDGANQSVSIEVDDAYLMQGNDNSNSGIVDDNGNADSGDWTNADNTNTGVDIYDDSISNNDDNYNGGSGAGSIDENGGM